ncbi:MAG: hypothetical protein WC292_00075 [Clostridia bacterium]
MSYNEDLLKKIAQENETAQERINAIKKPNEDRFRSKLDALWGKGVPYQMFNITVELKFSMRSWAFLETNNIEDETPENQVMLFAMASTLHDDRVDWAEFRRNGFQFDKEFQEACMKAFEMSHPMKPTAPPDPISARVLSQKPRPGGFGIDYMSMLVTLGKQFGWTKEEFWAMSPREIGLILDEYNWDVHYQNIVEKEHMKRGKR